MVHLQRRTPLTFKMGVNHSSKKLEVQVFGESRSEAKGNLTEDEIDSLMARLSQLHYALVLSKEGCQINLAIEETIDFQKSGEYAKVPRENILKYEVGIEDLGADVVLIVQGSTGRLSGFRMSPDKAREIADDLRRSAGQIPKLPSQFVQ